ncbi:hypothetical protein TNCV_4997641 [Trichonephila clavipes]|nr:hypothetical protein TNCV_4997641 [Trichonephila clavipes]
MCVLSLSNGGHPTTGLLVDRDRLNALPYSIGMSSEYLTGQFIRRISSLSRNLSTRLILWGFALSSVKIKSGVITESLSKKWRYVRPYNEMPIKIIKPPMLDDRFLGHSRENRGSIHMKVRHWLR